MEALRRGSAASDLARASRFQHRQLLIRSPTGTRAVSLGPGLQVAGLAFLGLCIAGVITSLGAAVWLHRDAERMAGEVVRLRAAAELAIERAGRSTDLVQRLGLELSLSLAERDNVTLMSLADSRTLAEQGSHIARLAAERAAAIDRAIAEHLRRVAEHEAILDQGERERMRLVAEHETATEQAAIERAQIVEQRDRAMAERDAAWAEIARTMRDLEAKTHDTVADVERIIASAGLDSSRLLRRATGRRSGPRGGPFIPWKTPATATEGVADLDRLRALRDAFVHLPLAAPMRQAEISDGFGFRRDPFNGQASLHEGIDLRAAGDRTVHAAAAGTVRFAGWRSEFGNMVEIDHGFGLATRYAHLERTEVATDQQVGLRQPLGVLGATGRVTGAHLHYEIRVDGHARDPITFLKATRHASQLHLDASEQGPAAVRFIGFHGR